MPIDFKLRPVQLPMVFAHGRKLTAVGLDFFKLTRHGVVAIRAPTHVQVFVVATQANFALVMGRTAHRHDAVAEHALNR